MKSGISRGNSRVPACVWPRGHRFDPRAQKQPQPRQQTAEVVAGGGEQGVDGVAFGALEIVAVYAVVRFGVADDGLDRRASAQIALDGVSDAAFLPLL